ncbi:MAG TPA: ATP-binding cassette domain-containing protein [Candidatus Eremiobacteraceae bacterium]|nr:ATP-binding cassette domain-containing protein [Candidatus Eremiobacteraceae bacterium]
MLLEAKGISKRFGPVAVLHQVDFEAPEAHVTALLGDNGAGKSTLIKCIAGVLIPDDGEIYLDTERCHFRTPHDATQAGIATVYQDLALCDNLDVAANLFLGRESVIRNPAAGAFGTLDDKTMEVAARGALSELRVEMPSVRVPVEFLSGGQRQAVAIAKTLVGSPRVVILDEPTAALGVAQTRQVLDLIRHLRARGHAVVLITHNLADVFDVADTAIVLRLGRRVATFNIADVTPNDIVAAITGARGSSEVSQR